MNTELYENYKQVKKRLLTACRSAKRNLKEIELVAVSKKQSIEKIRELYGFGHRVFAESYTQELEEKRKQLSDLNIKWIYIGRIQSNKINKLAFLSDQIQSLCQLKHAKKLNEILEKEAVKEQFPVYILVNAGAEKTKDGIFLEDTLSFYHQLKQHCPHLDVQGIMALPPLSLSQKSSSVQVPKLYEELRDLAKQVGRQKLSLGMSLDLEAAIKAGSHCVRVGTAIFSKRSE